MMKFFRNKKKRILVTALSSSLALHCTLMAQADGLAPEVIDLNAKDVSMQWEKNIPYLDKAYISEQPKNMNDGIPVGSLDTDGVNKEMILDFAKKLASNSKERKDKSDSLLISHKGNLIFESYYRRGRQNLPHFQMSITKSLTAFALGRAIQLGYLKMADLKKPVIDFLKGIDRSRLVLGAEKVTLEDALKMRSGVKLQKEKILEFKEKPHLLIGQKQIQSYFEASLPIPQSPRDFGYKAADPAMIMQVLDAIVPGSAKDFIEKEFLGKMGISEYAWQKDTSGLPKSAAGSSFRSRDMLKIGMLIRNQGKWQDKQLIHKDFIEKAVSPLESGWGANMYGYFCWHRTLTIKSKKVPCIELRGALGQFVILFPEQDIIVVATAHGAMTLLKDIPEHIVPAFLEK